MNIYTVTERDMLASMIVYLEDEGKTELSAILQVSRFVYCPHWEFSKIISDQKNLSASLRVPIRCKKTIEDNLETLSKIACQLYIDDEDYYFIGITEVGMLPVQTEDIEFENKHVILEKDSVFTNFIKFTIDNSRLSDIQKKYLFEACECGDKNNILSATVMLGASAEMLLFELCGAYKVYLDNQGDTTGADAFEKRVINARCAHDRLIEFLKRANSNSTLFKNLGFEDINLNFSFFDIIRQTRNDSGHPTGNTITIEQFKMILSNYQHFLPKIMDAIDKLPTI
ncbi:hypothetical protein [Clostridium cochlearium]|uniref:Uncharacterized protein n=1 Tax=Clostridium cochlearium TaxID=1494 RepID=A0A2X2YAC9_CLOCO|nr:hypothetical protein [Clostridium cochlearium]SQB35500.1 Uncharacterised protein [Clostridium cochlearium]